MIEPEFHSVTCEHGIYYTVTCGYCIRDKRIAALEAALRDVYEIYAGSEGLPESTASEAYLARLVRQMAHRAAETFTVEREAK